jgi:DNA topoisomerase IB
VARLKRVDCSGPGLSRRRRGKGFEYLDEDGNRIIEPSVLERIRELAIPPAWDDVWVCPWPMGHIQATGTDVAGRKQYRYHDRWRGVLPELAEDTGASPDVQGMVEQGVLDLLAGDRDSDAVERARELAA